MGTGARAMRYVDGQRRSMLYSFYITFSSDRTGQVWKSVLSFYPTSICLYTQLPGCVKKKKNKRKNFQITFVAKFSPCQKSLHKRISSIRYSTSLWKFLHIKSGGLTINFSVYASYRAHYVLELRKMYTLEVNAEKFSLLKFLFPYNLSTRISNDTFCLKFLFSIPPPYHLSRRTKNLPLCWTWYAPAISISTLTCAIATRN